MRTIIVGRLSRGKLNERQRLFASVEVPLHHGEFFFNYSLLTKAHNLL